VVKKAGRNKNKKKPGLKGRHAVASVIKNGKVTQKRKAIVKFEGEGADIRVSLGATLNMGNYESLRIGVDLSVPCEPNTKSIESAFQSAATFVDEKLDQLTRLHKGETDDEDEGPLSDLM